MKFSPNSPWTKSLAAQLSFPEAIRVELVHEHGAMFTAVPLEVSLPVAVDVQSAHHLRPRDGLLPDPRVHDLVAPRHVLGKTDVDRHELRHHGHFVRSRALCHERGRVAAPSVRSGWAQSGSGFSARPASRPSAVIKPARNVSEAEVTAVAARDRARADGFATKHGIPTVHDSYAALLADPEIDAIYNPLPNGLHAEWTIAALEAGKHVLCEKPFTANTMEAEAVADVADAHRPRGDGGVPLPLPPARAAHARDRRQRRVG